VKRWPIILGRGGTVLLAIGLALFLVSLIPSMQLNSYSNNINVHSKTWEAHPGLGVLTPLQTLQLTVSANGTFGVYLLETELPTIVEWITGHYSESIDWSNVTYFDQFLHANPSLIAWQSEIQNGTVNTEYAPDNTVNMTLAISTHGSDSLNMTYSYTTTSGVAPTAKVRTLSEFVIPIGIALTIPWLRELLRAKRRQRD
jgi:hypothetical protein